MLILNKKRKNKLDWRVVINNNYKLPNKILKKCLHKWVEIKPRTKTCSICGKIIKNKYNAIKTTVNGVVYDSKKEATVALLAEHKLKNGEIKAVERQVVFKFPLNCKRPPKMIIDFGITKIDDTYELWEVKGGKATMTPVYKLKKKLLKHFFNLEPIEI
jgi:hypothetical protein